MASEGKADHSHYYQRQGIRRRKDHGKGAALRRTGQSPPLNLIRHVGTGTAHHNDRGGFFGRGIAETRVKRDALRGDGCVGAYGCGLQGACRRRAKVTKNRMRFGVKMLATEEQFLIRVGERYPLKMNIQNIQNKIILTNKTLKNFGSLAIRECMHFFTLTKDPVVVMRCRHSQDRASTPSALRKIKPQRAQRITESCYFYLSPPLCHSVPSVVF